MHTTRFRVKKQNNDTYLSTITKRQEEYLSSFSSTFEWLPYIVGNTILIGLVVYLNYDKYISNPTSSLWEIFSSTLIGLSVGCVIAYILYQKR